MLELAVFPEKCVGCRLCELACSAAYEGKYNPKLSRIRVVTVHPVSDIPVVCVHCKKPRCLEVCPSEAIRWDKHLGVVKVDGSICLGCSACVRECPFEAMVLHPTRNAAIKCELCGGKPKCVAACPTGALVYAEPAAIDSRRKQEYAARVARGVEESVLRR
jgi:carbon-monoxide dehydrogenase iron sulfur subunit